MRRKRWELHWPGALGLGSIGLLFMGRLFNLLFYTGMGYLTMRRMPFGKEVVFGVGLLPMTLNLVPPCPTMCEFWP